MAHISFLSTWNWCFCVFFSKVFCCSNMHHFFHMNSVYIHIYNRWEYLEDIKRTRNELNTQNHKLKLNFFGCYFALNLSRRDCPSRIAIMIHFHAIFLKCAHSLAFRVHIILLPIRCCDFKSLQLIQYNIGV